MDGVFWQKVWQFEKFEQISRAVKGRTLKFKTKDLKIPYVSHFICLLTYYYMCIPYMQNFKKMSMPAKAGGGAKLG